MQKLIYALLGLSLGVLFYINLTKDIPTSLLVDTNTKQESTTSGQDSTPLELNYTPLWGYKLTQDDVLNLILSNKAQYGRSVPTLYLIKETEETEETGSTTKDNNSTEHQDKPNPSEVPKDTLNDETSNNDTSNNNKLSEYAYLTNIMVLKINNTFNKIYNNEMTGYRKSVGVNSGNIQTINVADLLAKSKNNLVLPVDKELYGISSHFGVRKDPFSKNFLTDLESTTDFNSYTFHTGLDIASYGINNADVYSMLDGTVKSTQISSEGLGNLVIVNHGTFDIYYAHLSNILVKKGDKIKAGKTLGRVGATGRVTGPHLHLEIEVDGVVINPEVLINAI